ncbi:sulfite exporter TauE/SafE family protein [Candidatus Woesearchaeota archaeon]|nr:sulfite exporter TauE/SafE family protein [Candidatus Woesearchaeota archaeon]
MDKKHLSGWEIAEKTEKIKSSINARLRLNKDEIIAAFLVFIVLCVLFFASCWLAGNPFEFSQRLNSDFTDAKGWAGTNEWSIIWSVVVLSLFFGFMDAAAGMGFGTAMTPLLLIIGFNLKQIVPALMIQQAIAGLADGFLDKKFKNVDWRFKPMSETVKLWLIISVSGSITIFFSVNAVYSWLRISEVWIKIYVAFLLLGMGIFSLFKLRKKVLYRPWRMLFYSVLASFNKGVGGGGYGSVITIGGMLSGVQVKSMLAITALSEGTISAIASGVWFYLMFSGLTLDFMLLPSMMLATIFYAVAAPYAIRVLPSKMWRFFVPVYCCIVAAICFWKIMPAIF